MTIDQQEVVVAYDEHKKAKDIDEKHPIDPITVSAADGVDPALVPTSDDLATLPRVPAAMP